MSFSSTRSERGHKSYFASVSLVILFCLFRICCFLVSSGRFAGIAFGVLFYVAHWISAFPSLKLLNIAHYHCLVMEGLVVDCDIRLSERQL